MPVLSRWQLLGAVIVTLDHSFGVISSYTYPVGGTLAPAASVFLAGSLNLSSSSALNLAALGLSWESSWAILSPSVHLPAAASGFPSAAHKLFVPGLLRSSGHTRGVAQLGLKLTQQTRNQSEKNLIYFFCLPRHCAVCTLPRIICVS